MHRMAVGYSGGAEEWREFAIWVQIPGTQRHRPFTVLDQVTRSGTDGREPVRNVVRITD